ncbi:MAG: SPFH domain-containing protein [Candidatus Promineifilaceae bacterium]|nr:SPFH domain-containing protein [Candidatus Promineifilaceae bacterium]
MSRSGRRNKRKLKQEKQGLGELRFALLGLLLAAVGYIWTDFYGIRLGLIGSYVWLIAFVLVFALALFYQAQIVLPLRGQAGWYEGLRLILAYHFPTFMGALGRRIYKPPKRIDPGTIEKGLSIGFMRHGAGFVRSEHVLALSKGTGFARAAGPGFVRLRVGERVAEVLDLRTHRRQYPVKAATRDGIELETTVAVTFHIRREDEPVEPDLPYPYDPDAVFQVHILGSFSTEEGTVPWSERVGRQATSALVTEMSRYTMDQLFGSDEEQMIEAGVIANRIERPLQQSFQRHGIDVRSVSIGQFKLPDEVMRERMRNWQAQWQTKMAAERRAGEAEAQRRLRLARARAQIEIIDRLTRSIDALSKRSDLELSEVVAIRVLEALQQSHRDESVQPLLPEQTLLMLSNMQALLQDGRESS